MNRLDTYFGNDGLGEESRLKPFAGLYHFCNRTFSITIWAINFIDAEKYCLEHGLNLDGQIIERLDGDDI